MEFYRKDSDMSQTDALAYGTGIFLMTIVNGMSCLHLLFRGMCVGAKIRVGVCNLVYHKVRIVCCYQQFNTDDLISAHVQLIAHV